MTLPDSVITFLYRWRVPVVILVLLGAVWFAPAVDLTAIDNDLSAWVSKDDPVYRAYDRFRNEFGGTRNLIIAIKSDRLFTPEGLRFIDRVTANIERVDMVTRVQSLATANIVRPLPATADDDGGIEVTPLLEGRMESQANAASVAADAIDDPLMRGDLVSDDGTVAAIIVTFDEDRIDDARAAVLARIREVVSGQIPAGFEAHYNGSLEISETYNRVTIANTRNLTPPILLITLIALYGMFRSIRKTLLIAVAIGVSVLWTLGLYSAFGFSFNVLTSMLTPLVVVLAIADDVHIVQHFDHELRITGSKEHAFRSSISHLFAPLLGASGTTALGMLSLATSDIVAVRTFGIGAAVGIMVDFALSLAFVPALLTFVRPDPSPPPQESWFVGPMRRVGAFAFRRPALVLAVMAIVAIVAGAGVTRLRVDTNHINFFSAGHPLTRSATVIDHELGGIYSFNVLLEGAPDSLRSSDALSRIDHLSQELEALPNVRKVVSVASYVKRVHQQLNGGDRGSYALPGSSDAIAQELFVFGLSDQGRAELERVVASDYSRAQISVKLASMSSDLLFEEINRAERLAHERFAGSGITATVTGSGRIFATLDHYLVTSQISSFGTAFVTVFGVIFIVFRSARFGVLGIIANTFPVVVVFGLMGWLDISLNVATIMVASVTLGIVDDDTIHFIGRYRREIAGGSSTLDAVQTAAMHEGRAALTTTIINALGYTVLMASEYRPTAWFGSLLALSMIVAFIAEVLLVPAIISLLPRVYGAPVQAAREPSVA
jgi:predicted RND superfamily exporter protein